MRIEPLPLIPARWHALSESLPGRRWHRGWLERTRGERHQRARQLSSAGAGTGGRVRRDDGDARGSRRSSASKRRVAGVRSPTATSRIRRCATCWISPCSGFILQSQQRVIATAVFAGPTWSEDAALAVMGAIEGTVPGNRDTSTAESLRGLVRSALVQRTAWVRARRAIACSHSFAVCWRVC